MKKVLLIYLWALQIVDCSLQSNLTSFDACCPNLPKPARVFPPVPRFPAFQTFWHFLELCFNIHIDVIVFAAVKMLH